MKNFSLKVKGERREAKDKRLQRCLQNARKASYSLEAAMPQCKVYGVNECKVYGVNECKVYGVNECKVYGVNECKVYGVECKGEGNNPIPSYTTLHHPTQREATGEEIVLIILCHDLATANRALDIIKRDLGSQLLQVEQCDTVVGAYLSILQGFNPSECLSFYHYHLNRSLGHQAQIWITTKGGKL